MKNLNFPDFHDFKLGTLLPLDEFVSKVREDLSSLKDSEDAVESWIYENIYWLAHDHLQKSGKSQKEIDELLTI